MTTTDGASSLEQLLGAGVQDALDGVTRSYGAVLRDHYLAQAEPAELAAGLACLRAAEKLGADPKAVMPAASALALLGSMTSLFDAIRIGAESALVHAWGMPRVLNAGDAFYALAHTTLLKGLDGLSPEARVAAVGLLDDACAATAKALSEQTTPLLSRTAEALAGVFAASLPPKET